MARIPPVRLVASLLLVLLALPASADRATIYAGTWGPGGAREGRVFRYEGGVSWTEISPPGGLADCVWDLEWIDGELWAATHDGPPSTEDPDQPHGDSGRIFKWDGTTWTDMSPPGGFTSAVTTVSNLHGTAYITVDHLGLLRHASGTSWDLLGEFRLAAQAIVSDTHDGRPMLYLGQDNTDEFWVHDPDGIMPCGEPAPNPGNGLPRCQIPSSGLVCSADCFPGSCIHAFEEFDAGDGKRVYAGTWQGQMYRWDFASRLFQRIDPVPVPLNPREHVDGLAAYHGKLWAGMSSGALWSTTDATSATWQMEVDLGQGQPFSEMVTVPEDDVVWTGFGGVPWRWARRDGFPMIRTWDGTAFTDRALPGSWGEGVLVLLPVVPTIECNAGPDQVLDCGAAAVDVHLDGTASTWSKGFDLTATWTGPFVEGSADGLEADVHFAGPGDYTCTLHLAVRGLETSCDVQIHVSDFDPPQVPSAKICLWPPNHRYRCFSLDDLAEIAGVVLGSDDCEAVTGVRIVGASSSQPEEVTGEGDGHTQDDVLFDDTTICVRSERQGADMAGRTYTVIIEAVDAAGNVGQGTFELFVPHDERRQWRCRPAPFDVGLRPRARLPLGPGYQEGSYP
jgi:hypothetical protein